MLLTRGISRERRKAFSALDPGGGQKMPNPRDWQFEPRRSTKREVLSQKKHVLGFLDSPPRAQVQITRAQEMRHWIRRSFPRVAWPSEWGIGRRRPKMNWWVMFVNLAVLKKIQSGGTALYGLPEWVWMRFQFKRYITVQTSSIPVIVMSITQMTKHVCSEVSSLVAPKQFRTGPSFLDATWSKPISIRLNAPWNLMLIKCPRHPRAMFGYSIPTLDLSM